jgi:glutamine synthetase
VHDATYPKEGLVSHRGNGYRDLLGHIDLATYRRLPWEDNIPFFLLRFSDQDAVVGGEPSWVAVDPRNLLEKIAADAKAKGWACMSGAEFEVRISCDVL